MQNVTQVFNLDRDPKKELFVSLIEECYQSDRNNHSKIFSNYDVYLQGKVILVIYLCLFLFTHLLNLFL